MIGGAGLAQAAEPVAPKEVTFTETGAIAESLTGAPGNPEEGAKIVGNKSLGNCVACHMISDLKDIPFHGEVGPPLDGVATRWEEAQLRGIMVNAKQTFPGTIMPAFYHTGPYVRPGDGFTGKAAEGELPPLMTAEQVEDVVAYLMTLDTYPD
ncbi:sulfur oxidation c-type cytochrome SoxX [Roseivivax sp. CAU 1761]